MLDDPHGNQDEDGQDEPAHDQGHRQGVTSSGARVHAH
jgi:hypothetical protein